MGGTMKTKDTFTLEKGIAVCALNESLKNQTGVDFIEGLTNLANNEKATELEAKAFIKEYYPVRTQLTPNDNKDLLLLLDFYIHMSDEHDLQETAISYCCCQQRVVPYEGDNIGLSKLLGKRNPVERSFAQDFFPQE